MNQSLVQKAKYAYRTGGLRRLFADGINFVLFDPLSQFVGTPTNKIGMYNGVGVRNLSLLASEDVVPDHEAELFQGIRTYVKPGDSAVVVGGGNGPSTVCSARQVGPSGSVTTFEGAAERVEIIQETARLNSVADRVTIRHAVVESAIDLMGEAGAAEHLSSSELPDCDSLILDCEGAEQPLLENLQATPRVIVVEVHPTLGVDRDRIESILRDRGYDIVSAHDRHEHLVILSAVHEAARND